MYSDLVFEGDNPQNFASKRFDTPPESIAVPFLGLCSDWILQNLNAPFLFKIWPFAQNFILKIWGVLVMCHTRSHSSSMTGNTVQADAGHHRHATTTPMNFTRTSPNNPACPGAWPGWPNKAKNNTDLLYSTTTHYLKTKDIRDIIKVSIVMQ